ncbi:hypothetical protein M433DRAFT_141878 [Acidomyces richmondensis BFW]|nr:MAG: hypothetical protein FE78DRAFT_76846 [Acidomyces sp. 'richmondensis']KYG47553.1 hypothetical protein M433DRAFT_141878 [Acidomyces richmondensis BFW]
MAEGQQGHGHHRHESTLVQSFSADLDSMFGLGGPVGELEQTVEEKKQGLNSASNELQQLEARLRETEERLAKVSRGNSPARPVQPNTSLPRSNPDKQLSQQQALPGATGTSPLAQKPLYPADRPPTAHEDAQTILSKMPGVMPPTETPPSGNDYVMVQRDAERAGVDT